MHLTRRSLLAASAASAALPALAQGAALYGLKPGKPYAGAKLNMGREAQRRENAR